MGKKHFEKSIQLPEMAFIDQIDRSRVLTRFHACSRQSGSSWLISKTGTRHCELSENFAVQG